MPASWRHALVYFLLTVLSAVFLFPLAWMVMTSLKPVYQTMTMPPVWIPMAYYAVLDGRRVEVTRDYQVARPSVLVVPQEGPLRGRKLLLPADAFDPVRSLARISGSPDQPIWTPVLWLKDVPAGWWRVTEVSPTTAVHRELAWDVLPSSAITGEVDFRWENYPRALATLGGRSLEETERPAFAPDIDTESEVPFYVFLVNTLTVCILGVIGAVLSNAIIAYGLSRVSWKGREPLFWITLATMMIPFPVLMVPVYGIFRNLGWIGTLLPLWVPAFFGNAFFIFLMRQFFRTIPEELSEAARIDGCSEWMIFWRIILPLSKPALAVVALFHFLGAWNDFMGPLLFLTRKDTFTLALALQNYQSQHGGVQWHYLMAASTVVTLPIIILFFLTQKTFVRGIATTGIKG